MNRLSIISKDKDIQRIIDKLNEIVDKIGKEESEGSKSRSVISIVKKANKETGLKLNTAWGEFTSVSGIFELEK